MASETKAEPQFAVGDWVQERERIEASYTQPGDRCQIVDVGSFFDGSGHYYMVRRPDGETDPYAPDEIEHIATTTGKQA